MSAAAAMHGAGAVAPGPAAARAPPADARPTLLVTTVDIGEGRQGRIEVRVGDDPVDVARAFCQRHGLPEAIVLPLAQHLEEKLADSAAAAAALSPDAHSTGGGAGHGSQWDSEEEQEQEAQRQVSDGAGNEATWRAVWQEHGQSPLLCCSPRGRSACAHMRAACVHFAGAPRPLHALAAPCCWPWRAA